MRRELQTAQEFAEAAIPLATEQASALWAAASRFIQGFARATRGERQSGLAQMSQSLTTVLATGAGVFRPTLLVWFAEAHKHLGQAEEGLRLLAEAQEIVDDSGQRYNESELYRIKGELLPSVRSFP
jgi:predicted ATPase